LLLLLLLLLFLFLLLSLIRFAPNYTNPSPQKSPTWLSVGRNPPVYSWIHSHPLSRLLFGCTEIIGTHTPTHLAHTDSAAEWYWWAF
jgi:hypothetical protein